MRTMWALLLLLALGTGSAKAELRDGTFLLTLNLAPVGFQSEVEDGFEWGSSLSGNFEKVLAKGRIGLGAALGYFQVEQDFGTADSAGVAYFESFPLYLTGRVLFGSPQTPVYVGLGIGVHYSSLEKVSPTIPNGKTFDQTNGLALLLPLGLNAYVGQNTFLNFGFALNWLYGLEIENDLVYIFNVGIGFQFGT